MITTDGAMPVRQAYEDRTGLRYDLEYVGGTDVYVYGPAGVFFVDDIRYEARQGGVHCRRLMVELIDDHYGPCDCDRGTFPMMFSQPPTEAELDHWVLTNSMARR